MDRDQSRDLVTYVMNISQVLEQILAVLTPEEPSDEGDDEQGG